MPRTWTVILPLKGGPHAKSRLHAPTGLARAIALDCLTSVLAASTVARVLVVTPDAGLGAEAVSLSAQVVEEPAHGGLNGAVAAGAAVAQGATAVLLGDLPALRPGDLDAALAACAAHPLAFVPDADGEGTVLLAGRRPDALVPRFGADSAAAHRAVGAVELALDLPGLRRDVDTPADLDAAARLGLGPRTREALAGQ
ncbi:2-phospho-L-lactate guanylyltransferase [Spongisporangium articulatum]|uniref:Phosphoenolpyruvate guanylyltransferase n=1 Tax=Spongisporangium articulatum TaxID=3362603 RepID=A0ABW8AQ68_9ACTN